MPHTSGSAPPPSRDLRSQALSLADPAIGRAALAALPCGAQLLERWDQRAAAVGAYRAHLTGDTAPDADLVLMSLLHLHHARMIGIDPDSERACLRLARAAAQSWAARTSGAHHRN